MEIIKEYPSGVKVIQLKTHGDDRGYFEEIYSQSEFEKMGINLTFVQDNCSYSLKKGTIRGLHWQNPPMEQSKLIRCARGRMMDIAVDVTKGSPTFGMVTMVELKENDHLLVLIPTGHAHGVAVLEDNTTYNYKVENLWSGKDEAALAYNDPSLKINWEEILGCEPILSDKDKHNPDLEHINSLFIYEEVKHE
ncbi:MAG: dTDP-4-dehydrorhamnose 3,5-epimerase [Erysipelotrichaceae bacterium]|nr:dTDP-4-dehydrorhamnose 3,5-epimerase [Erysipelotrichaceae bacterium]